MTRLKVKWAQVLEDSSPPKLPCFLPALAQMVQGQTSSRAKKNHLLSFPPHTSPEEGKGLSALHSQPACPPSRAAAWHGR